MKKILVPLDGSEHAEEAIPVAAGLARLAGAELQFVTVEPPTSLAAMSSDVPKDFVMTPQELRDQLRTYLAAKAEALRTTHGVRTAVSVLRGIPPAALAAYAEAHEVDLVVMTSHGRGGLSRFWLGSVADQLLRRTTKPVLLLRPTEAAPPPQFHCVLIAIDGSTQSEGAISPGVALARTTPGSRVILARVIEPPLPLVGPEYEEDVRREATARLEHLAHRLRLQGVPATVRLTRGARVADRIHQLASTEGADLIVVGTHGARGVERLLLGSVADKVVRASDQPVLVVPCKPKPVERHLAAAKGFGVAAESPVA